MQVPLMSHLAQAGSSPRAVLPLIRAGRLLGTFLMGKWLCWGLAGGLQPGPPCCLHRSVFPWSCPCFGEELVCTPGGGKHWIHLPCFASSQGCFFLVTSTMESKMSVVAGISFGIACFQVNLPRLPREGCTVKLACLQRSLISVQSLCVQKARLVSVREEQLLWIPPAFNLLCRPRSLTPRAEAPALFP